MSKTHTLAKSALILATAFCVSGVAQAKLSGNTGVLSTPTPQGLSGNTGVLAGLSGNTGVLRNAAPAGLSGNTGVI
jgi:hypothetical protein